MNAESNIKSCCATCHICGREIAFGETYRIGEDGVTIYCIDCSQSIQEIVTDNVNHPSHYTDGKIEVIDFIEDKKLNYHRGNAIKYIARAGKKHKNKEVEDLQKAVWYLTREIERLQKAE